MNAAPAQPRKSRIMWIILGLVVLFVALWSGYWTMAGRHLEQLLDRKLVQWRDAGVDIRYGKRHLSGWPYRFAMTLNDVSVLLDDGPQPVLVHQPKMVVHAMAWNLSHLIVEADGDTGFQRGTDFAASLRDEQARASIILDKGDLSRFSMELVSPEISQTDGTVLAQSRLVEFHVRPGTIPQSRMVYLSTGPLSGAFIPVTPALTLKGSAEVFAWDALVNRHNLRQFRAQAGKVQVDDLDLQTGDATLQVSGLAYVDLGGHVAGRLKTHFTNPADLLSSLKPNLIGDDMAQAIQTLHPLIGGLKEGGMTFTMKKGGVYAGPFRLSDTAAVLPPVSAQDPADE